MNNIFSKIAKERKRQNEKWGEQNHPMLNTPFSHNRISEHLKGYRKINDSENNCSWFAILQEEVFEAFAETDYENQREELIQVAAVAVQIIEYLDRNFSKIEGVKK